MNDVIELEGDSEIIVSQYRGLGTCEFGLLRENYSVLSQVKIDTMFGRQEIYPVTRSARCIYYEPPRKEKNQQELADIFVKNIVHDIDYVKANFSDIRNRQVFFQKFKKNINAVWDFVSEKDFSENLVMALMDSIENLKAENITYEQLDVVKRAIEAISEGDITEEKFDIYLRLLIENDIPLIRLPSNISDLYD